MGPVAVHQSRRYIALCVDVTDDTKILNCTMILHGLHVYGVCICFLNYSHYVANDKVMRDFVYLSQTFIL